MKDKMTESIFTISDMLRKVQSLLAMADNDATEPAAADNYRLTAEKIMLKYRIEEENARLFKMASGTAEKPVVVDFTFNADFNSPYRNTYYSMLYWVCNHVGIRMAVGYRRERQEDGSDPYVDYATLVGFDSDVQTVELIYTNLRLAFSMKMEPKYNPYESDEDNVYRLRSSGMERDRIARLMWNAENVHTGAARVTKLYKAACIKRGEDPKVVGRQVNVKTFRATFAEAFASEIYHRLERMRATAGLEGSGLVLAGRKEVVDEAFYERFPDRRPRPVVEGETGGRTCPKCVKAKSGRCRDHSYRAYKARPYSSLGATMGRRAAQDADLSRAGSSGPAKLK